jgi:prefoldin beta subunit
MNQENLQELQFLEQNINSILMQKRAIEMEVAELESSLEEVKKNNEDIFKLIGNILIKTDKESVEKDLKEKIGHVKSRLKTYEAQEKNVAKRIAEIREEIIKNKKKE